MMFKVKQTEKDKKIVGKMMGEGEFETLLHEMPSLEHHRYQNNHQTIMNVSSISPSSSSGGFCSYEGGSSPFLNPFDENMYRTPSIQYLNSLVANNNQNMLDEVGLAENLYRMHIGDERKDCVNNSRFQVAQSGGFGFNDCFPNGIGSYSDPGYYQYEGFNNEVYANGGLLSSIRGHSARFDDDIKAPMLNVGNTRGSGLNHRHSSALYCDSGFHKDRIDYLLELKEQKRRYDTAGIQFGCPNMCKPHPHDGFYSSDQYGIDSYGGRSVFNPLNSSHLMHTKPDYSVGNPLYNPLMLKQNPKVITNGRDNPSLLSMTDAGDLEVFSCEDSFIIQGKSLKCVVDKKRDRSKKAHKKNSLNETAMQRLQEKIPAPHSRSLSGGVCEIGLRHGRSPVGGTCENGFRPRSYSPMLFQPSYSTLAEVQGCIYFMAKDQYGCRFLQRILDEGICEYVQIIIGEIIHHVVELMMDPFGNYLMQKLLDVCSEEQRMQIVLMVIEEPGELVRISLSNHGTRVVQKLIETLKTRQQISLVVLALEPGFLDLIKDLNGNHVLQQCLQCLSNEQNKFIFAAAAKFCVDIATHQYGCCVLNRCIAHSTGKNREKLIAEISANCLLLAEDAFGNYVVQYIIELKIPSAAATLTSRFEGHYVYLSMQKFGSHVVEKCLKCFEESQSRIIHELLAVPHFDQLLQDPFANYVIQSALKVTKGPLHALLAKAVRPYSILRSSPYCKKIFSRNLLKK